jgi:hypothetical protein
MVALSIAKKMHPGCDIENDEIRIETRFFSNIFISSSQVFF